MKRTTILNFALAIAIILAAASRVFAMRDPGGPAGPYADGMSLYEYARSVPVVRRDPTGRWTEVERKGKPRARVCSDSAQDTWADLAKEIHLDEGQFALWAMREDGGQVGGAPQVGVWYTVPNTIYSMKGYLGVKQMLRWALSGLSEAAKGDGYRVVEPPGTKSNVMAMFEDPDVQGWFWASHGEPGVGGVLYTEGWDPLHFWTSLSEGVIGMELGIRTWEERGMRLAELQRRLHSIHSREVVGRQHHLLGVVILFACGSAERVIPMDSAWSDVVSSNGSFVGFYGYTWPELDAIRGKMPLIQPGTGEAGAKPGG